MTEQAYFIKDGYRSRKENQTFSQLEGDLYWNEDRVFFSRYYQWDVYDYARKLLKSKPMRSVVDIGCGTAAKLMELVAPNCQTVCGVDQAEAIDFCKRHYSQGTFITENLECPRVEHGPYDLVICSDVIEHLLNPDVLLDYIRLLSHDGTHIVLSTPERDILRGRDCMSSDKPEHVREWNSEEFCRYLTHRGFKIGEHRLSPFIKFSLNRRIRNERKAIRARCGTVKTNQLVLCTIA